MKILFVGGTFNDEGGKPSSLVSQFASEIMKKCDNLTLHNGGKFDELQSIIETATDYDTVIWWANVPNDKPKIRDVKAVNSKVMLIGSKRNDNKYTYQELISFALGRKQNLVVTFSKEDEKKFRFTIYDPLGNEWYKGYDVSACVEALMSRLNVISKVIRVGSEHKVKSKIDLDIVPETLEWCKLHYVPLIPQYIDCGRFGHSDGTDGSCHWCREMTPYQFEMCSDETHIRGLLSPTAQIPAKDRDDAIRFIEERKALVGKSVDKEYLEVIKRYAEDFHRLIMPEPTTRFLGNTSFRCTKGGFPSFRDGDYIYVSKRNIDKEHIDENGFVPVYAHREGDKVAYLGNNKPSVDTPIQLELYELFPCINYMIHSHTYVKGGVFTETPLPCGAYEEVAEIDKLIPNKWEDFYAINLKGHGCIVMSSDIEKLKSVEFIARPIPEVQY